MEPTNTYPPEQNPFPEFEYASTGMRFLNFLIDTILYYGLFTVVFMVYLLSSAVSVDGFDETAIDVESGGATFASYLIAIAIHIGYYTLFEGAFKGRTIGKLITGTKAVQTDLAELTWQKAFVRSLCRLIPFEVFSGFSGHPWHDTMTDTMVINIRK